MHLYILYILCGLLIIAGICWAANFTMLLVIDKIGVPFESVKSIKPILVAAFSLCYAFAGVIIYLALHQPETVSSAPAPSVAAAPTTAQPLTRTIETVQYSEQIQQMTEEIERQSNAIKEHRQLAEELNNQLYIKSDLARMADRSEKAAEERSEPDPEPAEVTTQADQKKQRSTASTQTKPSYEGQIREIRVPEERIIRVSPKSAAPQIEEVDVTEDVPVYTAPPPSPVGVRRQSSRPFSGECGKILRDVNQRINRQEHRAAIMDKPVGEPTFFMLDGIQYVITPERREGDCTFYDVQAGGTRHCRHRLCIPRPRY